MTPRKFTTAEYPNIQVKAATINRQQLKSVYFTIKAYYETEEDSADTIFFFHLLNIRRTISKAVKGTVFKDKFLFMHDLADTFEARKNAFVNMEFTLFTNDLYDVNILEKEINKVIDKVYQENYINPRKMKVKKFYKERYENTDN